jgi:hypothetical protein
MPRSQSPSRTLRAALFIGGGIAIVAAALVGSPELAAQRPARPAGDPAGLWITEAPLDEARRLLIVVDPATRHTAIYHVDAAAGTMTLRSTRDITWDLMVGDFNAQDPRPAALRRTLQTGPAPASEPVPAAR